MTFNFLKYKLLFLLAFPLISVSLASCSEKEVDAPSGNVDSKDKFDFACEGYELGFTVEMEANTNSRSGFEDFEDYVETKDHFRIFFFDKDGNFMVNTMDRTVTPLGVDNSGRKKFYVRIPMNYIEDRKKNVFDVDAIKKKLKDDPFKIAILANWPNPDDNTTDRDPMWGWENSIVNPQVEQEKLKNIYNLHHLETSSEKQKSIYGEDLANNGMSKTTDWVEESGTGNQMTFKGKALSETNLIPMYGVQDFQKLGNNWVAGTTFYLSQNYTSLESSIAGEDEENKDEEYKGKDILLLRSLAKIEVYFPYEVSDVRMYYPNRTARCEPMDVFTPTDEIWEYKDSQINHSNPSIKQDTNNSCEWFLIGSHVYWSKASTTYQEWLSWFYKYWNPSSDNSNDSDKKYPHFFNPDLNPVEYVEFISENSSEELAGAADMDIPIGIAENWYKYVLYVPEKYMDDPNLLNDSDLTNPGSDPLISYIEFIKKEDSKKLRFYMADKQPVIGEDKSLDLQNVLDCNLWPILRNHKYVFYVMENKEEKAPTTLVIRARIMDWNYNRLKNPNIW